MTLKELMDEWLPQYQKMVARHTYVNTFSRAKKLLADLGQSTDIGQLDRRRLSEYYNSLIHDEGYSNASVRLFKSTTRVMMDYAVDQEYLEYNPTAHLHIRFRRNEDRPLPQEKYFDDDELKIILKFMYQQSPHYGRFCEFLYLTGMRYGEAAALYPSDLIKGQDGTIQAHIWGTIIYDDGAKKQKNPKTPAGRRDIVLSSRAIQICRDEMATHPNAPYIFSFGHDHPLAETNLNHLLRECQKKYDIHKQVTLHIFRHTHISKLAELGVPLYVIQHRVGHASSEVTREIYLHVTNNARRKLEQKIEQLWWKKEPFFFDFTSLSDNLYTGG